MVMRNPSLVQSEILRRRMFRNPAVYNRNDPVGIMGSSPELMQAVMRNQPQLPAMDTGNPFIDQGLVNRIKVAGRNDPRGGTAEQPEQPVVPEQPPVVGNVVPRVVIPVSPPKDVTGEVTGPKQRPVRKEDLSQQSLTKAMEKLIGNKSTEDFIKQNRDLLEKYAPIPEKKNMRKQYLTKFFLDMAARGAQGDKPLAAAATAAPGTFDEYLAAEEKQKDRLAERDLLTVSMGIADKKVQDASAQAINLKLLELAADQPEKMKQLRALMEMGLSETDALARVFPESTGGSTEFIFNQYIKAGHSHRVATIMAGNREAFTKNLTNKFFFFDLLSDPNLTPVDIKFLIGQARTPATPEEINRALEVGGHAFRVPVAPPDPDPQS